LLHYAAVGAEDSEEDSVDLSRVLSTTLNMLDRRIHDTGAAVTADTLPTVPGNCRKLQQLFLNLIENSIKYRGDQQPRIHVAVRDEGDHWGFSVADNGIGISPERAESVFQFLTRAHAELGIPGTGIGLALCKRIVEQHGGRLRVESEPGRGSTFFWTWPKTEPARE